jgi:hypothetical protein
VPAASTARTTDAPLIVLFMVEEIDAWAMPASTAAHQAHSNILE